MFTEEEQIEILEKLGYKVQMYSVDARLRESGYRAMVKNHYGYEVFKGKKMIGTVESVFKEELKKRIFNITKE